MHKTAVIFQLVVTLALSGAGKSLPAQAAMPVGIRVVDTSSESSPATSDRNFYLRAVPAAVFGFGTAAVVSLAGILMSGDCYDCGLNSQQLMALAIGAATIGAAAGASAFPGRGLCTSGERFRKSFVGASLGLAAGLLLIQIHPVQHSIFGTVPLGSAIPLRKC